MTAPTGRLARFASRLGGLLGSGATSKWLALAFRVYLAGLFIYASVHKIVYAAEFAESVAGYEIVPWFAVNAVAVFVPWLELVAGAFLLVGFRARAAAAVIFALLGVFTVAILVNLLRGANMSCGCFHSSEAPMTWWTFVRDLVWMAMAAHVYAFDRVLQVDRRLTFLPLHKGPNARARGVSAGLLRLTLALCLSLSACESGPSPVGVWTGAAPNGQDGQGGPGGGEITLVLEENGAASLSTLDDAATFRWSRRRMFGKDAREHGEIVSLHAPGGGVVQVRITPEGLTLPLPDGKTTLLKKKENAPAGS